MAITRTTDDYRSWSVNTHGVSPEEVLEYVNSITEWTDPEVKAIAYNSIDGVAVVNGLVAFGTDDELKSALKESTSAYEYNSEGNRVAFAHYYADRKTIEVQYDCHPLDPQPNNSKHSSDELSGLLDALFSWWKTTLVADLEKQANLGPGPSFPD